jgi:DNA polymerase-4
LGKTIGIKLRYDDFKSATRDLTLDVYTADPKTIRQAAGLCLKRIPLTKRLRLLGVRVGGLVKSDGPDGVLERAMTSTQPSVAQDLISQMLVEIDSAHTV